MGETCRERTGTYSNPGDQYLEIYRIYRLSMRVTPFHFSPEGTIKLQFTGLFRIQTAMFIHLAHLIKLQSYTTSP